MLCEKAAGESHNERERYITVTIWKKNIEEARSYFRRTDLELKNKFSVMGSKCEPLNAVERLRILHGVYRSGEADVFKFDEKQAMRLGHDFRDYICPDSMELEFDYFKMGERYGRVMYLKDYASYIKDEFIPEAVTEIEYYAFCECPNLEEVEILTKKLNESAENLKRIMFKTRVSNW